MPTQPPIADGDFFLALLLGPEKMAAVLAKRATDPGYDRPSPAGGGVGRPQPPNQFDVAGDTIGGRPEPWLYPEATNAAVTADGPVALGGLKGLPAGHVAPGSVAQKAPEHPAPEFPPDFSSREFLGRNALPIGAAGLAGGGLLAYLAHRGRDDKKKRQHATPDVTGGEKAAAAKRADGPAPGFNLDPRAWAAAAKNTVNEGVDALGARFGRAAAGGAQGGFDLGKYVDENPWAKGLAYGAPIGAGIGLIGGLANRKRKKHLALGDALMGGLLGGGAGAALGGAAGMWGGGPKPPEEPPAAPPTPKVPGVAGGDTTPEDRLKNPMRTVTATPEGMNNQRAATGINDYANATAARLKAEGRPDAAAPVEGAQRGYFGAADAFHGKFGDPGLGGYTGGGFWGAIDKLTGRKPADPAEFAAAQTAAQDTLQTLRDKAIAAQDTPETKATALRALAGVGPAGMWGGLPALAQNPQAWVEPPPVPPGGGLPGDTGVGQSVFGRSALEGSAAVGAARGLAGVLGNRAGGRTPTENNLAATVGKALNGTTPVQGTGLASRLGRAAAAAGRHVARVNPPLTAAQAANTPGFVDRMTARVNAMPVAPGAPAGAAGVKPVDVPKPITSQQVKDQLAAAGQKAPPKLKPDGEAPAAAPAPNKLDERLGKALAAAKAKVPADLAGLAENAPLVEQLARQTGRSTAEVSDMVRGRAAMAPEVHKALTAAGGAAEGARAPGLFGRTLRPAPLAPPRTYGQAAAGLLAKPFKGYGPLNPLNLALGGGGAFARQVAHNPQTTPAEALFGLPPGAAAPGNVAERARRLVATTPELAEESGAAAAARAELERRLYGDAPR